jgi:hypothetical protein
MSTILNSKELCGTCAAIEDYNLNNNSIIPIPKLTKDFKNKVKLHLLSKPTRKKKYILGVIKFLYNNKNYIHCPIKKITKKGKIKFGICKNFKTIEDTFRNRQKLCTHKFRFHYDSNKKNSRCLHLKVSKSIESILSDNID